MNTPLITRTPASDSPYFDPVRSGGLQMSDKANRDGTWLTWSGDPSIQYEIRDGFLRIRYLSRDEVQHSAWRKVDDDVDLVVRQHLHALSWADMPPLMTAKRKRRRRRHYPVGWLRGRLNMPLPG